MGQILAPTDVCTQDVIARIGKVSQQLTEGQNLRLREKVLNDDIKKSATERRKLIVDAVGCTIIFGGIALLLLIFLFSGLTAIIFLFVCICAVKLFLDIKKDGKEIDRKIREMQLIPNQYEKVMNSINKSDLGMLPPDYRNSDAAEYIYKALLNGRANTMQQAVNLYELSRK